MTLRPTAALLLLCATVACAQPSRSIAEADWCDEVERWNHDGETACEVRETMLRTDALDVEVLNGGLAVREWDRPDVLVRARVTAHAASQERAEALLRQTTVTTAGGRIRADLPEGRDEGASVSFEVFAPRDTDLSARAVNGPVSVVGLEGTLRARATNGPVSIADVSGDVEIDATNGPVAVDLRGDRWRGSGLAVRATNGPITLDVPSRYSARLAAQTAMGPIVAPGLAASRERGGQGDRLDATLGAGGALLTLDAQNGPVRIRTAAGD